MCSWKELFDTWLTEVRWPIIQQATASIWNKVPKPKPYTLNPWPIIQQATASIWNKVCVSKSLLLRMLACVSIGVCICVRLCVCAISLHVCMHTCIFAPPGLSTRHVPLHAPRGGTTHVSRHARVFAWRCERCRLVEAAQSALPSCRSSTECVASYAEAAQSALRVMQKQHRVRSTVKQHKVEVRCELLQAAL